MKTLELANATAPLATYARQVRRGPMVLTRRGRPVAALVDLRGLDWESLALSSNPEFMAILEESRQHHRQHGGLSSGEVRRRLGIGRRRRRA